jgi:hypothetical protein
MKQVQSEKWGYFDSQVVPIVNSSASAVCYETPLPTPVLLLSMHQTISTPSLEK